MLTSDASSNRFNRAEVLDRLEGDEELFVMLAEMFINEADRYVEQLRLAVDLTTLEREAHTVKGVLATFSDNHGTQLANEVEQDARNQNAAVARAGVEPVCQAIKELAEILKSDLARSA